MLTIYLIFCLVMFLSYLFITKFVDGRVQVREFVEMVIVSLIPLLNLYVFCYMILSVIYNSDIGDKDIF